MLKAYAAFDCKPILNLSCGCSQFYIRTNRIGGESFTSAEDQDVNMIRNDRNRYFRKANYFPADSTAAFRAMQVQNAVCRGSEPRHTLRETGRSRSK